MNLLGLERRVAKLEPCAKRDLDVMALDILNDNELGLVSEFVALSNAGFSSEQLESMMGHDSYLAAVAAIEKANQEHDRLMTPPKHRGKPLIIPEDNDETDDS